MALTPTELKNLKDRLFAINVDFPATSYPDQWSLDLRSNYADKGQQINFVAKSLSSIIDNISSLYPPSGTIDPNGNITANESKVYYRENQGVIEIWVNSNVGSDTGWIQVQ